MTGLLALVQFIAFNVAWFSAVWGGANGWPWLGSLPAVAAVALHLVLSPSTRLREAALILAVTLFGVLLECGFAGAGLIRYAGTADGQLLPPVFVWALWLAFGTLPNGSLSWLQRRGGLQMVLGAVLGPLAYWTGMKMGAAELPETPALDLFAIGFAWFLAFPAIMMLADAVSPPRAPSHMGR